jgi:hypothetical protein
MTLPDLVYSKSDKNQVRFSLVSCVTEDSVESVAIATPLDASPPPPPSNTFPIINIINDDPFPNSRNYPAVASTFTTRRRAQTSPRPVPTSIMIHSAIPEQQPTIVYSNNTPETIPSEATFKISKFWPRFKRMMMGNKVEPIDNSAPIKMKQLFESSHLNNNESVKTNGKAKRWPSKNRSRVGPQR